MLPSEYFRRQCYGTFWFERLTLPLLETYPDNFMFETDYPHPTSIGPGPASPKAQTIPSHHIEKALRRPLARDGAQGAARHHGTVHVDGQP